MSWGNKLVLAVDANVHYGDSNLHQVLQGSVSDRMYCNLEILVLDFFMSEIVILRLRDTMGVWFSYQL